jgi:hypothetical protein
VEVGGGLFHLEFLLGDTEVDAGLFAIDFALDILERGLHSGVLDGEPRVREVALVLFDGNARLGDPLVQGGGGRLELGFLFGQILLGGAGIEADNGVALLHILSGGRHPGDAEIGDHGGVDFDGAGGFEFTAAADDDQEIAVFRLGDGK